MLKLCPPLTLATALTLSACSLVPTYERPAAPVPAHFAGIDNAKGQAAYDIAWQDFFRDARLKRLIALALENNRDLRVAVLSIEQARAKWQVARADSAPTIAAGGNLTRGPNANYGNAITSVYTAGLFVTNYELDFFGRVAALSQAAQAQLLASDEARKTVQTSLIASVATSYLNLLADDALLRISRANLATREESLQLATLKFHNGVASTLELRQAEGLREGAKVVLAQQERQRDQDENALVLLLGQPLPADLPDGLPLGQQQLLPELPAGVPSELLTRRPDVLQAEQVLRASNANIGAARAAFFPSISLTAAAGVASLDLGQLFGPNSAAAWSFAPQVMLPIFDYGRNQANLASAKVGREIAVAQYEKAIQTGFREVSDALVARSTYTEQLRAQQAQLVAQEQQAALTELLFTQGSASALDRLEAQRALLAAQQATVQVQAQQVQNLVNLYKVLGGGWK